MSGLTGPEKLELFAAAPEHKQVEAWLHLRQAVEREREERIEIDELPRAA